MRAASTAKPDYTGLQLNTSIATLPIPILWGQAPLAPNVFYYANFQTLGSGGKGSGGKGGLFSGGSATDQTTYSADLMLALCEGPIVGIGNIWRDQSVYTLAGLALTLFEGDAPQSVWGYLESSNPAEALAYWGTAYVCAASYNLGDSATIGNHNFEVLGRLAGTGINGIDADPAQVIFDFLTNAQYGAGFSAAAIDQATLLGVSGDASVQTYCRALGVAFSPALSTQEAASSILSRWLQIVNCAAFWSEGQFKFASYADEAIPGTTQRTTSAASQVPTPASGGYPTIEVCGANEFVADGGVVYAFSNKKLNFIGAARPTANGTYGVSPPGTYLFAAGDEGQSVQIAFSYLTGFAFTPNLTPIYSLSDDDFLDASGEDPVKVKRADIYSLPTVQFLACLSRNNRYASVTVAARDQSQIELYGLRVGPQVQATEICDEINVGPIVAQTILQRALYVRRTVAFKIDWCFVALEPMDVVELTDASIGLNAEPFRITSIEEDDNGLFAVTAEELTEGVSTPALYQAASAGSSTMNRAITVDPVNAPPLIYEPTALLTSDTLQLWVGASGGQGGIADPNWGGALVFVSTDDISYSQAGRITQPLRQGVLTAPIAAVAGFDTLSTLTVDLAESGGVLTGAGSSNAALSGATLALIDDELLAYQNAMLVSGSKYALTGLARGLYGTSVAAHAAGAQFARLDGAVAKIDYPASNVGQSIWLKFQSFNVFGGGQQALSDCVAYQYGLQGAALAGPLAAPSALYASYNGGFLQLWWTEVVGDPRGQPVYEIRKGASWTGALVQKTQAHPAFVVGGPGTYWVAAKITPAIGLTVYSAPISIVIAANQIGGNLLVAYDEQANDWPGAKDNGLGVQGTGASAFLRLGGLSNLLTETPVLVSGATNASASIGASSISIASPPAGITGLAAVDASHSTAIPSGVTVLSVVGSVITLSGGTVQSPGVSNGDTIVFCDPDILESGGIVTDTVLYYVSSQIVDIGYLAQAMCNGAVSVVGEPVNQNILSLSNILDALDILGSASAALVNGWLEINTGDVVGGVQTWNGWQRFEPSTFATRLVQYRVALTSFDAQTIALALACNWAVYLPGRLDHYQNLSVPSGGLALTFTPDGAAGAAPFNSGPNGAALPYVRPAQSPAGVQVVISSLTLAGCTVKGVNSAGSPVSASGVYLDVSGS